MTELEKAFAGKPFGARDPEVVAFQSHVKDLCYDLNQTRPSSPEKQAILDELFGEHNPYLFIEPGFQCSLGRNIHFERMAMLNYNCTLLDSMPITIGDRTLIGPGCSLICTNHSIDAAERLKGMFDNRPITIGSQVWLGANVTVCPGVTIGDNAVIGAGSVVTKDIPADVVAVGNPCHVLRPITEDDRLEKQNEYPFPSDKTNAERG